MHIFKRRLEASLLAQDKILSMDKPPCINIKIRLIDAYNKLVEQIEMKRKVESCFEYMTEDSLNLFFTQYARAEYNFKEAKHLYLTGCKL